MKLSEFILENVNKIQNNPLDREKYEPDWLYFNFRGDDDVCLICVAGYVRALEGREEQPLSQGDDALDECREGEWAKASEELGNWGFSNDINCVPKPEERFFISWEEFDRHVESLKERALTLKEKGF